MTFVDLLKTTKPNTDNHPNADCSVREQETDLVIFSADDCSSKVQVCL